MIAQGPLSKVEDDAGSVALTRGVKRRRVDEDDLFSQGIESGGRVLETEGDATYIFKGPTKFCMETEGDSTWVMVRGQTKFLVEDATRVEIERKPGEIHLISSIYMRFDHQLTIFE